MNYLRTLLRFTSMLIVCAWFGSTSAKGEDNVVKELKAESVAFYWFNSSVISGAGNAMYGRRAYDQLLPYLALAKQANPKVWFVLFDGDCLTAADPLRNTPASVVCC